MAAETYVFKTTDAVGNREQLLDTIYDISPEETPFISNGGRFTADARVFDWQTDALDTPDASNFRAEANTAVVAAIAPTVRLSNAVQISDKVFAVSRTQELVKHAGRKSEKGRALSRKMAALKRDLEVIVTGNVAKVTTDPRKTATILTWIATNVDKASGGTNPSPVDGTDPRNDGTQRAFTETIHKNVLQLGWTEGAKFEIVMLGGFNKMAASAFTGIAQIRKAVEGSKKATIIAGADVYVGDFATVTFVPNRLMRTRDALYLDRSMYGIAYLDSFQVTDLAKIGDTAARKLITVEWGLRVNNEKGLGLAADLTTS